MTRVTHETLPQKAELERPAGRMTAAVLHGSEDLRVEQVDIPAIGPDEVLVRVRVALTDGTDLKVWKRGYHARMITPPAVVGHALVGEIVAVGPKGSSQWQAGLRGRPDRAKVTPHSCEQRHPRFGAWEAGWATGCRPPHGRTCGAQRDGAAGHRASRPRTNGRTARRRLGDRSRGEHHDVAVGSGNGAPRGHAQPLQRTSRRRANRSVSCGDSLRRSHGQVHVPPHAPVYSR